jgi:hypothetical protein
MIIENTGKGGRCGMTKEEAAIIIHKLKQDVLTGAVRRYVPLEGEVLLSAEFYDAINMAIENLKQEPCGNVISREAVLKCFTLDNTKADVWNNIKALPPVTSKLIECGDCVGRQAAIDACLNGWNKDYKEIVKEIRALPPVTPHDIGEVVEIGELEPHKQEGDNEKR